jgi:hypothetical protein
MSFLLFLVGWDWVSWYCGHYWPIVPAPGDSDSDCEEIGGMDISRGNRSARRKPAPTLLCPPQIPHDLTQIRTGVVAVESQRLIAWAMARPFCMLLNIHFTSKTNIIIYQLSTYFCSLLHVLDHNCDLVFFLGAQAVSIHHNCYISILFLKIVINMVGNHQSSVHP